MDTNGLLTVHLQKNIPMAAGLAGGSADAAACLHGLNELLGKPFTTQNLCDIGARLGADIPFCVRSTTCSAMTARGIGELLTPAFALSSNIYLVIACHGEGVSTPWAYRRLDELGTPDEQETERQYADYLSALKTGDLAALARHTHNCFERVVMPEREAVPMLMAEMTRQGAVFARMSGSGPSVVGFFDEQATAEQCGRALRQKGICAHVCRPLA
jgi:4-diphosphocytidyl-2-C-methyl-D-erythritol kinase